MRLFVYPSIKARRAIAALADVKVTKGKATVPPNVNLAGIKSGMICHPGEGRQVDHTSTYVIAEVNAEKGILTFESSATPQVVEAVAEESQNS